MQARISGQSPRFMKICMLTTTHPPHDGRIFQKEAKSLIKEHEVTLVAPSGEEGVGQIDGVNVVTIRRHGSLLLHPITLLSVFRASLRQDADVYHCHEPDALLLGVFLKALKGKKLIYDIHEHWPSEIPFDMGLADNTLFHAALRRLIEPLEMILSRCSDGTIAVSESVAARFNAMKHRPTILPNFSLQNADINRPAERDLHKLVYMAGNMHAFHGINECIRALEILSERYPEISLTLIGNIREDIAEMPGSQDVRKRITATGYLPPGEMYAKMTEGGIGLLVFQPHYYNVYIGLPNKLFDYMHLGLPVIASDFPEIRKIVNEADCGILVDPTDVGAITASMAYLIDNPDEARRLGENGRRAVEEQYNWKRVEGELLGVYSAIAADCR